VEPDEVGGAPAGVLDDLELGDHEPGGTGEGEEADALDAGEVGQLGGAVGDAHGGGGQLVASGAVDRVEVPRHDEVAFRVGVQVEADVGVRGHVEEEAGRRRRWRRRRREGCSASP